MRKLLILLVTSVLLIGCKQTCVPCITNKKQLNKYIVKYTEDNKTNKSVCLDF